MDSFESFDHESDLHSHGHHSIDFEICMGLSDGPLFEEAQALNLACKCQLLGNRSIDVG